MLVENLQEKTVVALRTVYDGISATSQNFIELLFTPRLKRNVKAARMRYSQHLEDQKKAKAGREKDRKRKALQGELNEVQKNKKVIESTIDAMTKDADDLAQRAERRHNFALLSESNTFRKKVSEKTEESKKLQNKMDNLKEKLKDME